MTFPLNAGALVGRNVRVLMEYLGEGITYDLTGNVTSLDMEAGMVETTAMGDAVRNYRPTGVMTYTFTIQGSGVWGTSDEFPLPPPLPPQLSHVRRIR